MLSAGINCDDLAVYFADLFQAVKFFAFSED